MKQKIAIAFGGNSPEHEVSLCSATYIFNSLDKSQFEVLLLGNDKNGIWYYDPNYEIEPIDLIAADYFRKARKVYLKGDQGYGLIVDNETNEILANFFIVFPIIHGAFGENGTLQGFFDFLGVICIGTGVLGSSICMDKEITKRILRDNGIPIARFNVLYHVDKKAFSFEDLKEELGIPFFVKPCNSGSSLGVSKVFNKIEFENAVTLAFQFDQKILVEEAIDGKEIECALLGNEDPITSVLGEITTTDGFYSYDVKYTQSSSVKMRIPAEISENISDDIRFYALKAYQVVCCEGLARVDFLMKKDGSFVVNEINTLPGFTAFSMYPKLFEYAGISVSDVLSELVRLALKKNSID
ncbi:D-alanine--D-alanine ligase [Myroides sp. 1354]|uniref:D-alanine--D-alanine ligase family protein n=1 Tax=unclassified Myroides TaxID=2642485 RepID=UPI0025764D80|nr:MULTISPECIES: D-alanine--D-alanine ligase family protein [unclassified Myroides]MDM1044162.1 D-alanine--D-alanine ligase [Myroides sp. R163-1]MDM1055098.1 D-alanine--D-alanine ligase [Myroides sp. 1354]MDM1068395.1 D-alanine--D-alanine ligase [Myroides sp. 1372]